MKKSISIWCFPGNMTLKDAMKQAQQAGFDGIELALNEQGEMALDWDPFKVKDIKLYADSIGLGISSFAIGLGWKYPLITRDAGMYKKAKDILQTGLRFAGILEVDCILSVPGTVNPDMPYDEAYERGVAAYKDCGKMAQEYGVTIGVENVWNKFLLSPLEAARFIDEIGHPWVQFFFDVGNVLLFGYPEQWIRILGKRIRKVHIKDFQTGPGVFATLLNGNVNYPAVTKALAEVGYDGYLVAEVGPICPAFPEYLIEETSRAMDKIVGR
jgi:L-ribulose-5-phosphate 3-epimerase